MARITLGAGRQDLVFEREGGSDRVTDFRSIYFESVLDEAQEVPPNNDRAGIEGTGAGVLNFARTSFDFSLDIDGIDLAGGAGPDDMTDMHIHGGAVGVAGPIIFAFRDDENDTEVDAATGTVVGSWDAVEAAAQDMTDEDVAALLAEETYFNIHTNRDETGFIRGQILVDGSGRDRIDLTEFNIGSFDTLLAITRNRSGDAVIGAFLDGEESTLRLEGVGKGALKAGHFVFAGSEADSIEGSADRDDLFGAGGRDTVRGRDGRDRLFGENGADTVSGGDGRDNVVGGAGLDVLKGGAGADRFLFNDVTDTGDRAGSADRVTDFVATRDLLGLAAIDARTGSAGNQAFTFIGDDAFDAEGQVRVTQSGGDTFISLNTTGSGGSEAMIQLDGAIDVTEVDLIL